MIAMFVAFLTSTGMDLPADQKRAGERGYGATAPTDRHMLDAAPKLERQRI